MLLIELVAVLGQAAALVVEHAHRCQQHRVLGQRREILAVAHRLEQLPRQLRLAERVEPAADEQFLKRLRQRLQRGAREAEAGEPGLVQAVGAARQQDAVAGLLPDRQGVGADRSAAARAGRRSRRPGPPRPPPRRGRPAAGRRCPPPGVPAAARRSGPAAATGRSRPPAPAPDRPGASSAARGRSPCPCRNPGAAPAAAGGPAAPPAPAPGTPPGPGPDARPGRRGCSAKPPSDRRWTCRRRPGRGRTASLGRCAGAAGTGRRSSSSSRRDRLPFATIAAAGSAWVSAGT